VISKQKPLKVFISAREDEGYLVVSNNLQLKSSTERSSKMGLTNIQKRYDYLSGKKIIIENENNFFKVKIPLLHQNTQP
jgi:hypothetical protein